MSQPLLSIGMIVKNEERCLEKCLKALEPLRQAVPCELVIADTGSTDKTVEIASKYADILFDFVWVNDFSKARNAVMDKCTGKWYLTLDADEYLVPDVTEITTFLTSKFATKMKQATIVQRNHFDKDMNGVYSDFNAMRMCRMDTGTRYTSTIHEHFDQSLTYEEVYILTNTIFDHDGYASISPEHKIKKEERNLELLEKKLELEPNNLGIILQCMESSSINPEKRRFYTRYGIEKLKTYPHSDKLWTISAPCLAKQIALYLNFDCDSYQTEWFNWVFKNFPESRHTTVDTTYIYIKYLFSNKNYLECIKYGRNFLNAVSKNNNSNNIASQEKVTGSLLYSHNFYINEVKSLIANAMIKEHRENEALKILTETELYKQNNTVINNWFSTVFELSKNDKVAKHISKHISSTLKKYSNETHSSYDYILAKISAFFSLDSEKEQYKLFEEVSGTVGLCVKIADAKTKEEVEELLNKIDNWNEFMPLALKNVISLKADLPKEFYTNSPSRTEFLITNLSKASKNTIDEIFEYFCSNNPAETFTKTSFVFKLLFNILLNNNQIFSNTDKTLLINKFVEIADIYLSSCYNPTLLQNEKDVLCISVPHLFSWYLVKANKYKSENPLEYIKILRTLLKRIPEAKPIVEFLTEQFKNEEDKKRQNLIKNASPELVAIAEQLKTMLSALPPDSPELLTIKQSPVYKQVAFLIEN